MLPIGRPVRRRIYPRTPIVEAVIDFRFQRSISDADLADVLTTRLGATYPHRQREIFEAAITDKARELFQ